MTAKVCAGIRRIFTAPVGNWGFRQRSKANEAHSNCNRSNPYYLDADSAFRMPGVGHARDVENLLLVAKLSPSRRSWREGKLREKGL